MAKRTQTARPAAVTEASEKKRPAAAAAPRKNGDADAGTSPTAENLDKVRDILFGAQMRDADRRFLRLEERLGKDLTDVREETRKRLESLEAFAKKEVQSLVERQKSEQGQRTEAVKELMQELRELGKTLSKRADDLEEQHTAGRREIHEELLEQSKGLRDDIVRSQLDLSTALQSAMDELRSEKADRSSLAELFSEMALRLNSDGQGR